MKARFVVIGNPIAHSLSPAIHHDFAQQTGVPIQYRRWLSPLDGFAGTVRALHKAGVAGANVTVPFKHEAAALATKPSDAVQLVGAANTLKFLPEGGIEAYNTDGEGLCRDLIRLMSPLDLTLSDVQILMLGAGGAAKGCLSAFAKHGVQHLTVLNRTVSKAQALAEQAHGLGLKATGGGFDMAAPSSSTPWVMVNATSSSLQGEVPSIDSGWWPQTVLAVDMMYGAQPTPFMVHAREQAKLQAEKRSQKWTNKLIVADGLGMLVNQAVLAFEIWTGTKPEAESTLLRMRQTLNFRSQ